MKSFTKKLDLLVMPILALNLLACGGSGGGGSEQPPPTPITQYSLGGDVSGLMGGSLTLQNNSASNLSISANGSFNFANQFNSGSSYTVTVSSQPTNPAQTCTVSNGTGTLSANISNVSVSCISNVVAELPSAGINFDTSEVAAGATSEELKSESELMVGAPQTVTYAYNINEPDGDTGETDIEVRMACTTKTYDIKSNPEKILLHGIDASHSWPGAILQGGLYRDGTLRSLNVAGEHREPVTVVIRNVYNNSGQSSSRTVTNPSLSTITDAVNELIIDGYNDNLPLGGSVTLSIEETKDASRSLLKGRLSARYGTVKGSLSASVDNSQSHNSIMINLTQNLFDVVLQEPASKEAWFNDAFFQEALAEKIVNGEISETNPPVYVSKVTYGRILNYTMSSTASSSELRTIAKLSQNTLVASASLELSTNQQKVQESINTTVAQLGGNATSAIAAAHNGDWGAYFAEDLSLTAAVPISFEFKNLNDNSPAGSTEITEVQEEICTPQIVVPGPYDFALEDIHKRPLEIGTIQQLADGDFNGDGHFDLVWNHLTGDENLFYVGYGTNEGRFDINEQACVDNFCDFSDNQIPWGQFKLNKGDFNGDGKSDLVWTRFEDTDSSLTVIVVLATETGFESQSTTFTEVIDGNGLQDKLIIADMNNDDIDDIILWFITREGNLTDQDYQILRTSVESDGTPNLTFQSRTNGFRATDISYPNTRLSLRAKDVDSDGWNDLLWSILGQRISASDPVGDRNVAGISVNQRNIATSDIALVLDTPVFIHSSPGGWNNYVSVYGDYDGDGDGDLVWIRNSNGLSAAVHQASFDLNSRSFQQQGSFQFWESSGGNLPTTITLLVEDNENIFTTDVNGDGPADVVVTKYLQDNNQSNFINGIAVMKGISGSDPFFNISTAPQEHPVQQDWENYGHVFVGDVNGDGLQDVIWNNAELDNSIYVAIAKSE